MIIGGHHYKVKLVDEMKVEGGIVLGCTIQKNV